MLFSFPLYPVPHTKHDEPYNDRQAHCGDDDEGDDGGGCGLMLFGELRWFGVEDTHRCLLVIVQKVT